MDVGSRLEATKPVNLAGHCSKGVLPWGPHLLSRPRCVDCPLNWDSLESFRGFEIRSLTRQVFWDGLLSRPAVSPEHPLLKPPISSVIYLECRPLFGIAWKRKILGNQQIDIWTTSSCLKLICFVVATPPRCTLERLRVLDRSLRREERRAEDHYHRVKLNN